MKWLIFIFFMAWTRSFLFNYVQINNSSVETSPETLIKELQRITYVLGWLLFGNIADNAFDPKYFLVFCTFFAGIWTIVLGIYIDFSDHTAEEVAVLIKTFKDPIMILYAGIKAFSMVQLFNWFPPRWRGTTIALFMTADSVGFVMEFASRDWWSNFPRLDNSKA